MFKMADILYAALTVFQGYCLQYFLGSLERNHKENRDGAKRFVEARRKG